MVVIYQNISVDDEQPTALRSSHIDIVPPGASGTEPTNILSTFDLIVEIKEQSRTPHFGEVRGGRSRSRARPRDHGQF